MKISKWNIEELNGYRPFTTFWMDFDIADKFGVSAIKDTYRRAFAEWRSDYRYLTELVMIRRSVSILTAKASFSFRIISQYASKYQRQFRKYMLN